MTEYFLNSPEAQFYLGVGVFLWAQTILVAVFVGFKLPSMLSTALGLCVVWAVRSATFIYVFDSVGLMVHIGVPAVLLSSLFNGRTLFYLVLVALIVVLRRAKGNRTPEFVRVEPGLRNQDGRVLLKNGDHG